MSAPHSTETEQGSYAGGSPSPLSTAQETAPAMRQRTIVFLPSADTAVTAATPTPTPTVATTHTASEEGITLHLSLRCFADYVLLFVTEDVTCAPGVVVRFEAPGMGPQAFMYEGETPSLEFTVLLGLRDHPLTNLLASSIAHQVRRYGEGRPLLMGLSVVQASKQLTGSAAKKQFLGFVTTEVLELAGAVAARPAS